MSALLTRTAVLLDGRRRGTPWDKERASFRLGPPSGERADRVFVGPDRSADGWSRLDKHPTLPIAVWRPKPKA
jgi:hypothetical protein